MRQTYESRELRPQSNAGTATLGVATRIPLKDVRPGAYVLRIEARASGNEAAGKPAVRQTAITVLPSPSK